tara:strand:+ start:6816 stop:7871 length:1056 start_codon:yes stop_codon:yes gene_type:complete
MHAFPKFLFLFSFILGQGFITPKINYSPRSYICYKVPDPILIDGKINDLSWQKAEWSEPFVDIEGDTKPLPFFDTKVKMLWDENYFYFGAYMEERHVWATLTTRDAVIFKDNDFEIFLDPDGDTHNYYELEVNALETEWDLLLLKPYRDQAKVAVDSWDIPGLITKVHVDGTINDPSDIDEGWSVEIAIPWKALEECAPNEYPKEGEQWKVNFSRVHWNTKIENDKYIKTESPEYNWVWSPQGIIAMHYPEMWGLVQFTDEIVGEKKIKYQPSDLDKIKWELRQIYYNQKNHFFQKGLYAKSFKELGISKTIDLDIPLSPIIVITPSGWQAAVKWNNKSVIIRQDGRAWVK